MTQTAAHTPGKWVIVHDLDGDYLIHVDGGKSLAITYADTPEDEANAALMARAPELLAENEQLRAALNMALAAIVNPAMMDTDGVVETVRAAIAKAEGK
jgi:hypothetical protein